MDRNCLPATSLTCRTAAFGLNWESALPLWQFHEVPCAGEPDIRVTVATSAPARKVVSSRGEIEFCDDGLRLCVEQHCILDIVNENSIVVTPLSDWDGVLPPHFFGTITALVAARRGLLPVHATTVEYEGAAFLLCGRSGAGKSTIGAHLLALGARFVSDDLTIIRMEGGTGPCALSGRSGFKLHPDTVAELDGFLEARSVTVNKGKVLALPTVAVFGRSVPLAGVVLLGEDTASVPKPFLPLVMQAQLFRPRLIHALGMGKRCAAMLNQVATGVPIVRMRGIGGYGPAERRERAMQIMDWIRGSSGLGCRRLARRKIGYLKLPLCQAGMTFVA